jgi:hypothetical protein
VVAAAASRAFVAIFAASAQIVTVGDALPMSYHAGQTYVKPVDLVRNEKHVAILITISRMVSERSAAHYGLAIGNASLAHPTLALL